jgi:hypothetical protein
VTASITASGLQDTPMPPRFSCVCSKSKDAAGRSKAPVAHKSPIHPKPGSGMTSVRLYVKAVNHTRYCGFN